MRATARSRRSSSAPTRRTTLNFRCQSGNVQHVAKALAYRTRAIQKLHTYIWPSIYLMTFPHQCLNELALDASCTAVCNSLGGEDTGSPDYADSQTGLQSVTCTGNGLVWNSECHHFTDHETEWQSTMLVGSYCMYECVSY